MKNGIKLFAALSIAFASMLGTTAMVNHVAATTAIDCGCGKRLCDGRCRLARRGSTCQTCDTQCGCVECPQCACEICKLELDHSKVKKTCFKVEQKTICVPPVRLPWKRDCPPATSKPKTVNVLKTHSYECPNCAYKWTLQKAEAPKAPTPVASAEMQPIADSPSDSGSVTMEAAPVPRVQPWHPQPQVVYGSTSTDRQ